ncbi:MAG: hypothetical protein R2860_14205 [Desulfobacterales bacterium]
MSGYGVTVEWSADQIQAAACRAGISQISYMIFRPPVLCWASTPDKSSLFTETEDSFVCLHPTDPYA